MNNPVVQAKLNIPNCITAARIAGTIVLLFLTPLTSVFFILYTLCGFSDILDGWIARKTNTISEFGAKLDSIADLLFYTVMLLKIAPLLFEKLPGGIWIAVAAVLLVRIVSYVLVAIKHHRFASLHTYLNKLTGIAMFTVPYFIKLPVGTAVCFVVCTIAAVAALEELIIHAKAKNYDENTKSILKKA